MDPVVTEGRCVDLAVTRSVVADEPMPFTCLRCCCARRVSFFVYNEEKDLFRFPDGRFAFSREWADIDLLQERGYG